MNSESLDYIMKNAKVTLNKHIPNELRLIIGNDTSSNYYTGAQMGKPLIFYLDYMYAFPEKLVIGTSDTSLTSFP